MKRIQKFETYENIRKITTGLGDDYTSGCLLDYPHFKRNYKIISIDSSKQQALDADPRSIQQVIIIANSQLNELKSAIKIKLK